MIDRPPLKSLSPIAEIASAAARRAATETIMTARKEGRSLVVDVDGEPRLVPAVDIPTPDERDAAQTACDAGRDEQQPTNGAEPTATIASASPAAVDD